MSIDVLRFWPSFRTLGDEQVVSFFPRMQQSEDVNKYPDFMKKPGYSDQIGKRAQAAGTERLCFVCMMRHGDTGASSASRGEGLSGGRLDDLFVEAARTVVMHQQGSTSLLQRKFNIGFNRAGRIMDQLCQAGIVGEQDGSKPRQVFCSDEADLEFRLKNILSNNQA